MIHSRSSPRSLRVSVSVQLAAPEVELGAELDPETEVLL